MPLPTGDILTETFDNATDYDNSGWTTSGGGTINPNYTGTVLEGTQSLLMDGTTADAILVRTFTGRSSIYFYFQLRLLNTRSDNFQMAVFADANPLIGNYLTRLLIHTSGSAFLLSGSSFSGLSVGQLAVGTTYHCWMTYIKGTGADAFSNFAFSTDGVRPTSGNNYIEITDSTVTANVVGLQLSALVIGTPSLIFDCVVLNTTQIGDATAAVDVTVNLTGVAADPQIGVGTVEIGSVVVEPPAVGPGGGTGRPARTGMRLRPTEDKFVYLKGVAANPRVGQVLLRSDMQRAYEAYSAPIRRAEARKPAEMPPGMRRLFKPVEKPIPPTVFVYQVGLPKLKSAVGAMTVKAFYEDIDEELVGLLDAL